MVYILLDTNIIIDMVVDRRNKVSDTMLRTFVKLLDYGEITLIVPDVIKTETNRHLDEEIDLVGKNIDSTMKDIDNLYGVQTCKIDSLDLSEYKKKSRAELHKAQQQFQQYKENYRADIHDTISLLFEHQNTIFIDDELLMMKVQKRRVHKQAPFHKELKESYGDGVIVESLVNIKDFAHIELGDRIYFVSGNYKDFSASDNRDNLHPDIIKSLESKQLDKQVEYVRTFNSLISVQLQDCVERAELTEEFEAEMCEREEDYWRELEDSRRENVGLTPLGFFIDKIAEDIPESIFADEVVALFDRITNSYSKLEELYWFFEEELQINDMNCVDAISKLSDIAGCDGQPTVNNLIEILGWIEKQKFECSEIEIVLPDIILPGEDVVFLDTDRKEHIFRIEGLEYLSPSNGGTDTIDVYCIDIVNKENNARGTIDITYGFIEEDQFDGIGDGCQESIEYDTNEITAKLKEYCCEWDSFIREKETIVERIRNILYFE